MSHARAVKSFRAEKRTAQYIFCGSLAKLAGSGNDANFTSSSTVKERRTDIEVREDVVRLIYLYLVKHEFFRLFTVKKTRLPCLLRGFLAYIFSSLLINMQDVKRVCGKIVSSYRNFLCTPGK